MQNSKHNNNTKKKSQNFETKQWRMETMEISGMVFWATSPTAGNTIVLHESLP